MNGQAKFVIIAFLIAATAFEVSGDAIVRLGLGSRVMAAKGAFFLAGAACLFIYGLCLNLAPLPFHRVVGIYIATLFLMWQLISFLFFRSLPSLPVIVGGVLIVAGIQMLAIGLLGELQVRHYYTSQQRTPYAIDRLVRLRSPEEPSILTDRTDGNY